MIYDNHNGWTDLGQRSYNKPPHVVVKADEISNSVRQGHDDRDLYMGPRDVIYEDDSGNKYQLSLEFLVLAAQLTVAGTEGQLIGEDGAVGAAADNHYTIAGLSLGRYFDIADDDYVDTVLEIGDGIWVIRKGAVNAQNTSGGNTAIGDIAIPGADGGVGVAGAIATTQTTDESADIYNSVSLGGSAGAIGVWRAVLADDAIGRLDLHLPERFRVVSV